MPHSSFSALPSLHRTHEPLSAIQRDLPPLCARHHRDGEGRKPLGPSSPRFAFQICEIPKAASIAIAQSSAPGPVSEEEEGPVVVNQDSIPSAAEFDPFALPSLLSKKPLSPGAPRTSEPTHGEVWSGGTLQHYLDCFGARGGLDEGWS